MVVWVLVFVLSLAARLYRYDAPIADWHSWRQTDTAAVASLYVKDGIDILRPRYLDLSNIQSGKDNPQGLRMVEFPIYQAAAAAGAHLTGPETVEAWLRGIAVIMSSAAAVALGVMVTGISGPATGIAAAVVWAILPYSMFYGRAILPDGIAASLAVIGIACASIANHQERRRQWALLITSAIFCALALLVKPTSLFLLAPIGLFVLRVPSGVRSKVGMLVVFGTVSIVPLLLWRWWIGHYPEGIPAYEWLFNEGNIRFKGAWFWWLFAKRLGELILGYWGLGFFIIGVAVRKKSFEAAVYSFLMAGMLAYFTVFARGNVQHDYYQVIVLPSIAMFVGKGITVLSGRNEVFGPVARVTMTIFTFAGMLAFSWYTVRTYYWINRMDIIEAGRRADEILPPEAKVIASNNGDTTFLYFINRQGWPLGFEIEDKIARGATHYVTVSVGEEDGETAALASEYTVLERTEQYAIIDLTRKRR